MVTDDSRVPQVPSAEAERAFHEPILVAEIVEHLKLKRDSIVVDATLGLGGHTAAILATNPDVRVIGIDRDPGALTLARQRLAEYGPRLTTLHGNFADMESLLPAELQPVDGVLMDLGISSWQLATRGFSFKEEAPLDFRMNPDDETTAADLVASLPERELADLLYTLGEERASRRIAKKIVDERRTQSIRTTAELAEIVSRAVPRRGRLHPATKTFQALRIAVNDELGSLERGLEAATNVLGTGGILAVISFHSLEDRITKRFIANRSELQKQHKRVIRPTRDELQRNSRSRSAKLRVAEKQ